MGQFKSAELLVNQAKISSKQIGVFAGALIVLGVTVVVAIKAAGAPIAFEAESGTLASGATVASASGQSGSGVVKFGAAATPTPTPTSSPGTRTCPAYPAPPDASCTGVPVGTSLTTVSGSLTTSSNGQVIDSKLINGDVNIANSNVTIKNSRIMGRINNSAVKGGLVVMDSDIGKDTCEQSVYNNFNGTNYTMIRSHVHHSGADLMGIGGTGTILIQDSIVNQPCFYAGDHLDAVQFYSPGDVGHVTIQHTVLDSRAVNDSSAKGNAAIFWADNPGSGSSLTATQSFFAGGNYTVSLYDAAVGSGVVFDINNNTFVKNSWTYGPCNKANSIMFNGSEGLKFTGNKYDDGTALSGC